MSYVLYSSLAGFFGSIGSVIGKLAGSSEQFSWDDVSNYLFKVLLLVIMVCFNLRGNTFYAKSLRACNSSLEPTLISSSMNNLCAAFIGYIVFNEQTTALWWCGTLLILCGIIIVSWPQKSKLKKLA